MADPSRGKRLFDARVEYPLPTLPKTRDYLFFVPPPGDDYSDAAKRFFDDKRYSAHARHQVKSLEEIITLLHADISQRGVEHLREIVIVVHGNTVALQLPIFATEVMDGMKFVTLGTLACLQSRLDTFQDFRDKRAAVIAKLTDKSWIVLRVCRFGQAKSGLYALYSFFGGRADVFAPIQYQFFGDMTVEPGTKDTPTRFSTRLAYHDHLARQHFIKGDIHTPDRKDAIVRALLDPGSLTLPFELGRRPAEGAAPPEYQALIRGLRKNALSPDVRARFEEADFALTGDARSMRQGGGWLISDKVVHPDAQAQFRVDYKVGEKTLEGEGEVSLRAQARLVDAMALQPSVQIQLFLDEKQRADFDGRLFEIARKLHSFESPTADDNFDDAVKAENSRFDAYLKLLDDNGQDGDRLDDGAGADLFTLFRDKKQALPDLQELPVDARIKLRPPGDHRADKAWTIAGSPYKIHLEKHAFTEWTEAQVLYVYRDLDGTALFKHQYEVVAKIEDGHPDTPGVELQAYLDRLSRDELVDMIAYLRDPYLPQHAFYIDQAQLAIWRQNPLDEAWLREQQQIMHNSPLWRDSVLFLNDNEDKDKALSSHPFVFNRWWRSARHYDRVRTNFQTDLFAEESLAERFSIKPEQLCSQPEITFAPDSPSTNKQKTKPSGPTFDKYSRTDRPADFDKHQLEEKPLEIVTCAEFKAVILRVKELDGRTEDEVRDLLAQETTAGGTNFLDVMDNFASVYKNVRKFAKLEDLRLPALLTSEKDVYKWVIKKAVKQSAVRGLVVALEIFEFIELSILVPVELYANFLEDQQATVDHFVYIGRLVATRQYLEQLRSLARRPNFPDTIRIDLSVTGGESAALARYRFETGYVPLPIFLEDIERGFAEQLTKLESLQAALIEAADQIVTEVLNEVQLSPCKTQVLIDTGVIDLKDLRARGLDLVSTALLDKLPVVR